MQRNSQSFSYREHQEPVLQISHEEKWKIIYCSHYSWKKKKIIASEKEPHYSISVLISKCARNKVQPCWALENEMDRKVA